MVNVGSTIESRLVYTSISFSSTQASRLGYNKKWKLSWVMSGNNYKSYLQKDLLMLRAVKNTLNNYGNPDFSFDLRRNNKEEDSNKKSGNECILKNPFVSKSLTHSHTRIARGLYLTVNTHVMDSELPGGIKIEKSYAWASFKNKNLKWFSFFFFLARQPVAYFTQFFYNIFKDKSNITRYFLVNDICNKQGQFKNINKVISPLMPHLRSWKSLNPCKIFGSLKPKRAAFSNADMFSQSKALRFGMSGVSAAFICNKTEKIIAEIFIIAMLKLYGAVKQQQPIKQKNLFFYREKSTRTKKLREEFCGKNAKNIPKHYDWYVFKGKKYSVQARANNDHHFAFPLLYPGKILLASFTSDSLAYKKYPAIIFQFKLRNNQKFNPEKEQFVCFTDNNTYIGKEDVKSEYCFFVDKVKKNDAIRLTEAINTGYVKKSDIVYEDSKWQSIVKFIAPSRIWNVERYHNTAKNGLFYEHQKPENASLNGCGNYKTITYDPVKNPKIARTAKTKNYEGRRVPCGRLGAQQIYMKPPKGQKPKCHGKSEQPLYRKSLKGQKTNLRPGKSEQQTDDT